MVMVIRLKVWFEVKWLFVWVLFVNSSLGFSNYYREAIAVPCHFSSDIWCYPDTWLEGSNQVTRTTWRTSSSCAAGLLSNFLLPRSSHPPPFTSFTAHLYPVFCNLILSKYLSIRVVLYVYVCELVTRQEQISHFLQTSWKFILARTIFST